MNKSLPRLESVEFVEYSRFKRLRIEFPKIEDVSADSRLAEIHLFTGPNGSGKSSLLIAMASIFGATLPLNEQVVRRFRNGKGGVRFRFDGQPGFLGRTSLFHGECQTGTFDSNTVDLRTITHDQVSDECFYYPNFLAGGLCDFKRLSSGYRLFQPSTSTFAFAAFAYSGRRVISNGRLAEIKEIERSPFDFALEFDRSQDPEILRRWIANNKAKFALALEQGSEAEIARYKASLQRVCKALYDVCGVEIDFKLQLEPFSVEVVFNKETIPIDLLPDGLKSMITWIGDLAQRLESIPWKNTGKVFDQPFFLFLDEIDIHLHPKWQRRLLLIVQKLFPNAQIFASTHSPFVVGSVKNAYVYDLGEAELAGAPFDGEVEAVESAAGRSTRVILEEIFGVDEQFDVETEQLFQDFYSQLKENGASNERKSLEQTIRERGEEPARLLDRVICGLPKV